MLPDCLHKCADFVLPRSFALQVQVPQVRSNRQGPVVRNDYRDYSADHCQTRPSVALRLSRADFTSVECHDATSKIKDQTC